MGTSERFRKAYILPQKSLHILPRPKGSDQPNVGACNNYSVYLRRPYGTHDRKWFLSVYTTTIEDRIFKKGGSVGAGEHWLL